MIDSILDLIIKLAWLLFLVTTTLYFLRTAQRHGFKVAFTRLFSFRIIVPMLLILSLTTLSACLLFVEPQEIGVVVSVLQKEGFRSEPFRSGVHWIVPLAERVVTYPIYWQTYTMSGRPMEGEKLGDDSIVARTKDGQEVSMDCSIIFRIDPEQVVWIHIEWQNRYIQDFVRPTVRGMIRTKVADFTVNEVNSDKRSDLEIFLDRNLREVFEEKGLVLDRFVLRNIAFSPEYAASVEQKQIAEQIKTQRVHEAEQIRELAEGEADQVREMAEAEADRVMMLAEAEARAIEVKAQAQARARVVQAEAEAKALELITEVLAQNPDLLTYQYINKLAPSINVMLIPSDAPFILPLPTPLAVETSSPVSTPTTPLPTPTSIAPTPPTPTPTEILTPTLTPQP
jgi:regulator of protease activity HflC (stomatin/prohibitin superfamily)